MEKSIFFLLVDDDSDDRLLFKEAADLITPPVSCSVTENGKQALEFLNALEGTLPYVIFLDINMPVMNGWHCLKELKNSEKLKHIPVIMYSTTSHQREVDIACDLGAICFCVKPEKFTTLKHIIEVVNNSISSDLLSTIKENPDLFRLKKSHTY